MQRPPSSSKLLERLPACSFALQMIPDGNCEDDPKFKTLWLEETIRSSSDKFLFRSPWITSLRSQFLSWCQHEGNTEISEYIHDL